MPFTLTDETEIANSLVSLSRSIRLIRDAASRGFGESAEMAVGAKGDNLKTWCVGGSHLFD